MPKRRLAIALSNHRLNIKSSRVTFCSNSFDSNSKERISINFAEREGKKFVLWDDSLVERLSKYRFSNLVGKLVFINIVLKSLITNSGRWGLYNCLSVTPGYFVGPITNSGRWGLHNCLSGTPGYFVGPNQSQLYKFKGLRVSSKELVVGPGIRGITSSGSFVGDS